MKMWYLWKKDDFDDQKIYYHKKWRLFNILHNFVESREKCWMVIDTLYM